MAILLNIEKYYCFCRYVAEGLLSVLSVPACVPIASAAWFISSG